MHMQINLSKQTKKTAGRANFRLSKKLFYIAGQSRVFRDYFCDCIVLQYRQVGNVIVRGCKGMSLKLKAVGLFVKDMATMVAFYRDVVGFPLEWDGIDSSVIVEMDGLRFLLFGRNDFENLTDRRYSYPKGNNGTFELALDVDAPDEVDKEYSRIVELGAVPIIAPKTYPWGLRSCYITDPEGNLIEIATWKSPAV